MRAVFVAFHHPSGELKYAALETDNETVSFLPTQVDDELDLEGNAPDSTKYVQLGLMPPPVLLQR